ncbi:MAG: hypothetical protein H9872_09145 [Candidatus Cellulosilyticum pullistercoris]|uniref:ABC transporter permease n=1 Tax=Candidatus Cellulosilyticum pullistercoris TaxID=2838521 RepID=A0A9E2NMB9_9FIRM|nr:hypothetical protein [Candidatus Cellulosilyticum pullistercoris]
MKRLKALIKMELRPALLIGAYFLLVDLWILLSIQGRIQNAWRGFLTNGIKSISLYDGGIRVADIFVENMIYIMLLSIIGMIALVYSSFKNDKSIEIGRFLKSLPYTMRERCLTKMGVGIGTFTVTYIFYAVGMLALHMSYLNKFSEVYEVTVFSEVYHQIFDRGELIQGLILVYIGCIAIYLFCMMFQYLVSNRLGGIIVAALVYISPLFIINSICGYMNARYENIIYKLAEWVNELMIIPAYLSWGEVGINVNTATTISRDTIEQYAYINLMGYKIIFYGIIALLSLMFILKLCVVERIEKSDYFIPSKCFRRIFVCGVTVCGGLLLGDIYFIYSNETNMWIAYGLLILGGLISFLIAKKIASIGMKKEKEVRI